MSRFASHVQYAGRVARVVARDPREFLDRLGGQIEIRRERRLERPHLEATGDWIGELHSLMGWSTPCSVCDDFDRVWERVEATMSRTAHRAGKGYDAGVDLARGAYAATRHLRPGVVIETGVARGVTSRVILEAMHENDMGHLYSVDLPPLVEGWHGESAAAVTDSLRFRWSYVRGASRRVLPRLLSDHGPVPLFIHDSLHTYRNMRWELEVAWRCTEPGGLIISDDIEDNRAFSDFTKDKSSWIIAQEAHRSGFIGAIRK